MSSLTSEILFEKFQIIEVMKKDEHAAVFLANHIYLNKKIILKVLNTQKLPDPSMVERFKREGKILAKLDHPNIIKVLDFGLSKEYFYISFEYIEGESLRNVLKTKALTEEQKEHIMIQLLKGLDYAHKNQVIHRDIKPENIFIDKNLNVKLGDFGLALSAEDNFVTNPYSIVGTPSYMSPEQVRGAKLTPQSDIFSAGVVLFELFAGKNPFLRDNVSLTLNEIMAYNEDELMKNAGDQSQLIQDILSRMLKKTVGERYESAEEILDEMNVHVDQPTIVINNADIEGKKSMLAWIFIAVIFVGIAAIFILPVLNQPKIDNAASQQEPQNNSVKNDSAKPEAADQTKNVQKDQVDPEKIKEPLIENKTKDTEQNKTVEDASKQITTQGVGDLFVNTYPPNTEVSINGDSYGRTPFDRSFPIRSGEYQVKFTHPNYPTFYKQINVEADKVTKVFVNVEAETMGFIHCFVSPPYAEIFINGNKRAEAPMKTTDFIKVVPGPVRLVLKNPRFRDIDTTFSIRAKDTLKLKFGFKGE